MACTVHIPPDCTLATMQPTPSSHADIAASLPAQVVATLVELFGDDLSQWRFIVDLFTETLEQDLANLDDAIRSAEDTLIIEAAHRIVGSARMLGHQQIGDAARTVERIAQTIAPYNERRAQMQAALGRLQALAQGFRQQASGCAWPGSQAAS